MFSINTIAEIVNANAVVNFPDAQIRYLLTDSRRLIFPEETLFFAIKTAQRDGHIFINDLYKQGVQNFIVAPSFDTNEFPKANFLKVTDTLEALQILASAQRTQFHKTVIGITGSNGKTVVKEWLYQLLTGLQGFENIVRSPRSYNSQIGVPLSVWQINEQADLAIIEAGISKPDEMKALEKIIRPTIGILTNIGDAHDEGFENRLHKAKEKMQLFKHAEVVLLNTDDKIIQAALLEEPSYKILGWGRSEYATLRITNYELKSNSTIIHAVCESKTLSIEVPFTDEASIQDALICWCVLLYFKIDDTIIAQRMSQLQRIDMRLQLIPAVNGCSIVNDSYSFDTTSFNIALDFLLQQHLPATVILSAIPGGTEMQYESIASILHERSVRRAILIGSQWQGFGKMIIDKVPVVEFYSSTEKYIQQFNTNHFRNEAILLKGARAFGFEQLVVLLEKKVHETRLEINLSAMAHNLKVYQQQLKPGTKLMGMVKAFGYGSGSVEVANLLQFHKVDYLAVAYADEGVELRIAGIRLPIMVMNTEEAAFETLVQHSLEPEIYSFAILSSFNAFLEKQGLQQYPVHIKIDTGMHRLGFEPAELEQLKAALTKQKTMFVKSVFSHLVGSEDAHDDAFTEHQGNLFNECCNALEDALGYSFIKHIDNSAGILRHPELQFDMVRLGIGLYGIDSAAAYQAKLQTVLVLKTTIAQIRAVKANDTVGYNRRGKLSRDSIIATIRIGYADGFRRSLSNGNGKVYVNGQLAPIVGTVAMDMAMVDITDIDKVNEGDEVEIFGTNLPVQDIAKWSNTIPYEIFTNVGQRVKRVYVEE